jgi:hypothetical protein
MQSKATTVKEYLASLPEDRRRAMEAVRRVIVENLDEGYQEGMGYGMMGWSVPHSIFPDGYHCDPKQPLPFAGLASQKQAMSLYLMCTYMDEAEKEKFVSEWKKTGKKLDMGKSCIRFKKLEDLPLEVIGRAIKRQTVKKYIAAYLAQRPEPKKGAGKKAVTTATAKKPAAKKKATKAK